MPSRLPPYSGAPYMPSQQCPQRRSQKRLVGAQPATLLRPVDLGEVRPERGQALAVALLEPDHRAVELPLGQPLDPSMPHAPGQLVEGA